MRAHRQTANVCAVALSVAAPRPTVSACGSRLTGNQAALAQGAFGHGSSGSGSNASGLGTGAQALGAGSTGCASASSTSSTTTPTTTAAKSTGAKSTTTTTAKPSSSSSTTTTTAPCSSSSTPGLASGPTGGGVGSTAAHTGAASTARRGGQPGVGRRPAAAGAGACGANGNQTPSGGNGGATATGVTATTITVGNIASISGVAPGLTQSAQQATEAWAAYVNSTGGICGRQIKVQPFDDGNDSSTNYADASQACSSDFAMVGNASGFDDGSAQAVGELRHPDDGGRGLDGRGRHDGRHLRRQPGQRPLLVARPGQLPQVAYPNAIRRRR